MNPISNGFSTITYQPNTAVIFSSTDELNQVQTSQNGILLNSNLFGGVHSLVLNGAGIAYNTIATTWATLQTKIAAIQAVTSTDSPTKLTINNSIQMQNSEGDVTPTQYVNISSSALTSTGFDMTNNPYLLAPTPTGYSPQEVATTGWVQANTPKVFQKRILDLPFSGNIDSLIQLDIPVLGLCQISARMELTPTQSINIGDIFLKIKDGSTILANSLSQVNFQGLVAGELATAQISCMDVISTNAQMTFTLNNIAGTIAPYGTYSLFLDIIKM
jgi:hypothetical protein